MADKKSKKRSFIEVSSSEGSEAFLPECDDDDAVVEISSSAPSDDDDYDDDDDEEEEEEEENDVGSEWSHSEGEEEDEAMLDEDEACHDAPVNKDDEDSMCNKVIQFIRGRSDLQELKLIECKSYLRRHGLRLSGTKEECIERIKEHWRLKDGNGEAFYPKSSFKIDSTGDVCKGDVVLFTQKVYQTFDKKTRHGCPLGRRTVAGRIVKESYGSARQQHTFTVEVLWSRGAKKLTPLFPLLVKGRNLYKLKTFRQRWKNEKERLEVLDEKHKRGAAARTIRDMRRQKAAVRTDKSTKHRSAKSRKQFHHIGPSQKRETTHSKKGPPNEHGKVFPRNKKLSPYKKLAPFQTSSVNQNDRLRGSSSRGNYHSNQFREPSHAPYNYRSQTFNSFHSNGFPREAHNFPSHRGSASNTNPRSNSGLNPISESQAFYHGGYINPAYSHQNYVFGPPRMYNYFSR